MLDGACPKHYNEDDSAQQGKFGATPQSQSVFATECQMDTIAPVVFQLLGPFHISLDKQVLTGIAADKACALLTYLALEGAQPRTTLTALLWPYLSQEAAFNNLRKTLHRLRQRFAESIPNGAGLLVPSRLNVQLDLQRVGVDVLHFQTLLAE